MERMLRPMTNEIRQKIVIYRKNRKDIADLIRDVNLSNEDISNSYISDLNLSGCSISNINFSGATIKFQFQKGTARNCNFSRCNFLEGSSFRGADLRTCNCRGSFAPHVDYAYADLRQCDFCDATFTMFSRKCYKTKFDKSLLREMARLLDIEGFKFDDNI